ncbi:MAG: 5-formyltetrahydrofolate cyclo-ligase [Halioglobus sp.]
MRSELRALRRALGGEQQLHAAQSLIKYVQSLPHWQSSHSVALYCSADGEIDPLPLAQAARAAGKQLLLPVITTAGSLEFAHWNEAIDLQPNRFGIAEPAADAERTPTDDIDIIFLPLVAWDRDGGRLGMGGGYYDRTLEDVSGPLLVGLAHALQEVDAVPCERTDVRLDFVASDKALVNCQEVPQNSG